jgi:[acyl-carrier-protein] S-malonyltransferase
VLAVLAPGQGAQRQGFLDDWLTLPGVEARLRDLGLQAGIDLVAAGTELSDEAISDTAIAQPLIVGAGLAVLPELGLDPASCVFAGHSVGEFTAAAASGMLDAPEAMRLIGVRGVAMAQASAVAPSGMAALLGGEESDVLAAIADAGCVAANFNCAGQIVAAGPTAALERLIAAPPAGARVRPLAVAGAFHTGLMASARDVLSAAASEAATADGIGVVLSNRDGKLLSDGAEVLTRLVDQVCLPVRWDACMATMAALGVTAVIELPPAGTLTALVRRALPGVEVVSLRTPADLVAAKELVAQHSTQVAEAPAWQIIVAPEKGFVSVDDVIAQAGSGLIELLVVDGDPVTAGQPLARVSAL